MTYQAELEFFKKLLKNFHLAYVIITPDMKTLPEPSAGIYRLYTCCDDYMKDFWERADKYKDNVIYRINSICMYRYLFFRLPDTDEPQFMLIGPYVLTGISQKMVLETAEYISLPEEHYHRLQQFLIGLPRIYDESVLLSMLNVFGERIWGSIDNFRLQDENSRITIDFSAEGYAQYDEEYEEPQQLMKILEERYNEENSLIQAVARGQTHKAEAFVNGFNIQGIEHRIPDRLRNVKNYMIILNTLLRKAAESADVHPIHIDKLSSEFAHRIEQITSESGMNTLSREMVRKYCLLVTNHSMKDYSLLVRKVLTQIDLDLTADLSLKVQAKALGVNASYLSTLFKKETGKTLTEYVNGKRIEYAIFLLNSTQLQIQAIAQYCGISDVNYFTRLFKTAVGKTPKEYRDSIYI
ncbi:helix-turn-helix domain-containing protein [Blautia sp. An81]|uniref:helix-turn-helix domain-containing protein n=1 Tax=Blautia sp. An81 TaxID=1965659 RepID=UPI000B3A6C03|nr:AraC family transcriptional regulator [Blautia sp. An81]OUN29413.1 hypothetical protein B5G33_11340 [Blautia sp. An81]